MVQSIVSTAAISTGRSKKSGKPCKTCKTPQTSAPPNRSDGSVDSAASHRKSASLQSGSRSDSGYFPAELVERMSQDLHLTGKAERTHNGYLRAVRKLSEYCRTPPDKITEDQVRHYFLHMKKDLE